ncbi:MAG: type IV secretion system protein [Burkholderiales bacterium]
MNTFADFFAYLTAKLAGFIGTKTALVASWLEPFIVAGGLIYLYLLAKRYFDGSLHSPAQSLFAFMRVMLVMILATRIGLYAVVLTDMFITLPQSLASTLVLGGGGTPMSTIDDLWTQSNLVAEKLMAKASFWTGFNYYIAAGVVYGFALLTCAYTAFLFALAQITSSALIPMASVFILLTLWDATKRFFENYIGALANYGLIIILASLFAALLLTYVSDFATEAASKGSGIEVPEAIRLCLVCFVMFLVMLQVPAIAASLASGMALSTLGAPAAAASYAAGSAGAGARSGYLFGRGFADGRGGYKPSPYLPIRRNLGVRVGAATVRSGGSVAPRYVLPPPPRP